jgi:carnitine-CoA ligase
VRCPPEFVPVVKESGVEGIDIVVAALDAPIGAPIPGGVVPLDTLPGPDGASCVIYTSGTTGPAKGVVISWAQMSANIGRIPRGWLSPDDAVYSPWPMFHVTGRSPMMSMADIGGRVVLRERFARSDFWADVRTHRCTSATVGAAVPLLLAEPERDDDADNPLRIVLFGRVGQDGRRFLDRFDATGISFYGSTEVGFPIGNRPIAPGTEHLAGCLRPGYEGRVVDDAGDDVAAGSVGELWIRPPDRRLILVEYLNQPRRTANAIVDGWYRTGDAFRQHPDGSFEFVDRMGDTIRRFGENISSAALESAVMGDSEVLECAAVGVASPVTGHDVLLFVVAQPGAVIDPALLAGRLADHLPRYMRPNYIAVVDELPRTPNGKIRKVDLAEAVDLGTAWQAR